MRALEQGEFQIFKIILLFSFSLAFFNLNRDFPDIATRGFLHSDFIGQKFICYLLKKTGILMMYRLEKSNTPTIPIIGKSSSIPAKDAICVSVSSFIQYQN